MASKEMFGFLIKVITSWQIIVVSIVLILYVTLVSYAARTHHRVNYSFDSTSKKAKKEKPLPAEEVPAGDSDDLGLEE